MNATTKRPVPVTVVAFLFIAAGIFGLVYHGQKYLKQPSLDHEVWILLLRALALIAGIFMLRGSVWARWLAIAWMVYHVILSLYHSISETLAHLGLLVIITVVLFLPKASAFFRNREINQ